MHVEHDDPLADAHLGGGEADARSGIHRLGHVVDQPHDVGADARDGGRALLQDRVWVREYRTESHGGERAGNCDS